MTAVWKRLLWLLLLLAGLVVALLVVFWPKPMLQMEEHPDIISVFVTVGQDGETQEYILSQDPVAEDPRQQALTEEWNDKLVSLLSGAEMRRALLDPPEIYSVTDGSVEIWIHVAMDTDSISVNLCTDPQYNYVKRGDTYYRILDHGSLYQSVYECVAEAILR